MGKATAALFAELGFITYATDRSGSSGKPPSTSDHAPYGKTAMAADMLRLMASEGFSRFSLAGHDRGGRVAYRHALDHPDRVDRLALLDIIPTDEVFERADARALLAF
jgi:haloacetate dehalogenase